MLVRYILSLWVSKSRISWIFSSSCTYMYVYSCTCTHFSPCLCSKRLWPWLCGCGFKVVWVWFWSLRGCSFKQVWVCFQIAELKRKAKDSKPSSSHTRPKKGDSPVITRKTSDSSPRMLKRVGSGEKASPSGSPAEARWGILLSLACSLFSD